MNFSEKKRKAEKNASFFLYGVLTLSIIIGLVFYALTPADLNENFCPTDKTKINSTHVSVVIDLSDELTNLNKKIVKSILFDWLDSGIEHQELSVYSLNSEDIKTFEDIDTICSPPSQVLLSFKYGRQKANQRVRSFKDRLQKSIESASAVDRKLQKSRILESIRQVTNSPNWIKGSSRLVLISDLIENSELADFYSQPVPDFKNWLESNNNRTGLVNSIQISKGDKVQICQLQTDKPNFSARDKSKLFWVELFDYKGIDEIAFNCSGLIKSAGD